MKGDDCGMVREDGWGGEKYHTFRNECLDWWLFGGAVGMCEEGGGEGGGGQRMDGDDSQR